MSFLDTLKTAVASAQVQFNVFLIEYKPDGKSVFAFLEGRDDPSFYRRFLMSRLPNGYRLRLVNCGSRSGVIDAVNEFRRRYKDDARVVALIDKDHSDLVPGSATTSYVYSFQTWYYSIENYVCDAAVVRRHCVEVLGLPDMDQACDQIHAQYERGLAHFHDAAKRCMAWVIAARRRGDKLHLNGLDSAKIFTVDDDLLGAMLMSDNQLYDYLERVTGGSAPTPAVSEASVDAVVAELSTLEPKKWIRGKQELWFTVTFINKVAPAVQAKNVRAGARVVLNASNAVDLLAARCDIPAELDAFLAGVFANL